MNSQLINERDDLAFQLAEEKEASATADEQWRRRCDRQDRELEDTENELHAAKSEIDQLETHIAHLQQPVHGDIREELVQAQQQRDLYKSS